MGTQSSYQNAENGFLELSHTHTNTHITLEKTFIDKVVELRQHKLSDFKETKQIAEAGTVAFFGGKKMFRL